jgi:hypothetical protein
MPPVQPGVNTRQLGLTTKVYEMWYRLLVSDSGEGGELMLVSARIKLALLAIGSVVAAALIGGCPWGP